MTPPPKPSDDLASADRAFARFCRSGDADALAQVFDQTAPRLAVLAGHIVPGDAQAVEDLVQTTFVEAMRSAGRFEQGRPVMPWLVAILGRRAANLHRERQRPGANNLAANPSESGDNTIDPARLVADKEFAENVATAIECLDNPYREVLALRLVHGLKPAEIARALGRPQGVRPPDAPMRSGG